VEESTACHEYKYVKRGGEGQLSFPPILNKNDEIEKALDQYTIGVL
jgi:hypothetical protein